MRHRLRSLPLAACVANQRGLTLLEVLITVGILALLLTIVTLSFSSTFRILDLVAEDQGRAHIARLCLGRMADELVMARRQQGSPWIGKNAEQDGKPADILTFVSSSHQRTGPNMPETDLTRVLYAREGTRLVRFARPNLYALPVPEAQQDELAAGVVAFNLRYFDRIPMAWIDEWDGLVRSGLPAAVLIELTLTNGRNEPRTYVEWVTLPVQTS